MLKKNNSNADLLENTESDLHDYFRIIRHRWKIVFLIFLLVFTSVSLYTFLSRPIYEASSTLEIRAGSSNNLLDEITSGSESAVQTEIEKINSRSLAERIIRRLNLDWPLKESGGEFRAYLREIAINKAYPELRVVYDGAGQYRLFDHSDQILGNGSSGQQLRFAGGEVLIEIKAGQDGDSAVFENQTIDEAVEQMLLHLEVQEIGKLTNVIRVTFLHHDPLLARDVVNLLVDEYLALNVAQRTQEAGKAVDFIAGRLRGVKEMLDRSEKELQQYKIQTGRVTLGPEGNSLLQKLVTIEQQKADIILKRQRIDYAIDSLTKALENNQPFIPPTIEGVPQIAELAGQLAQLEAERKALLNIYTPAHPEVLNLQTDIQRIQNAMLSTYQTVRQELILSEQDLGKTLASYEKQMGTIPEAELELAKRMRVNQVNSELYTFLLQKQQEASIAEASTVSNATVIDRAIIPVEPVKPNKVKNLALGSILGLLGGIGVAFFVSSLDNTIKTASEVRDQLGLVVYSQIPFISSIKSNGDDPAQSLVVKLLPKDPVSEAFRTLRTNLQFVPTEKEKKVIMITSSLPSEGKSTVSANLALALASQESKVLLVNCDLRRPSLHKFFGQSNEPGLSDLLMEISEYGAIRHLEDVDLDFYPGGTIPPNPADLIGSDRMKKFLKAAREKYDYIILDVPPVLPVTDAQLIGVMADLNLIVMEPCRVPQSAALQMIDNLRKVNINITGVILNDKSGRGFKYYGDYGYYGNESFRGYYGESGSLAKEGPAKTAMRNLWNKLNS